MLPSTDVINSKTKYFFNQLFFIDNKRFILFIGNGVKPQNNFLIVKMQLIFNDFQKKYKQSAFNIFLLKSFS